MAIVDTILRPPGCNFILEMESLLAVFSSIFCDVVLTVSVTDKKDQICNFLYKTLFIVSTGLKKNAKRKIFFCEVKNFSTNEKLRNSVIFFLNCEKNAIYRNLANSHCEFLALFEHFLLQIFSKSKRKA